MRTAVGTRWLEFMVGVLGGGRGGVGGERRRQLTRRPPRRRRWGPSPAPETAARPSAMGAGPDGDEETPGEQDGAVAAQLRRELVGSEVALVDGVARAVPQGALVPPVGLRAGMD